MIDPKHFKSIEKGNKSLRSETLRRRQTQLAQRITREPRAGADAEFFLTTMYLSIAHGNSWHF
jgi:hypothetical protein